MLHQQQKVQFSEYSSLYDLIVPKENLLRKINNLINCCPIKPKIS